MQVTRTIKLASALVLAAGTLAAGAARADDVYWQVGFDAPVDSGARIQTRIGNVRSQPVVVTQAPVIYAPAPVVVQRPYCPEPRRVVYVQPEPAWSPARVVYREPVVYRPWWHHHHHGYGWGERERFEPRRDDHDDRYDRGGRGHHGRD